MQSIPDDPIIVSMMRTGYPPWYDDDEPDYDEPFAVYDINETVYEDGAQIGQRGWEGGLLYNFCHNLQGKVKYFRGTSITNPGKDRSKIFSSLMFQF